MDCDNPSPSSPLTLAGQRYHHLSHQHQQHRSRFFCTSKSTKGIIHLSTILVLFFLSNENMMLRKATSFSLGTNFVVRRSSSSFVHSSSLSSSPLRLSKFTISPSSSMKNHCIKNKKQRGHSNYYRSLNTSTLICSNEKERRPKTMLMMEADDDDTGEIPPSSSTATAEKKTWNIPELKKEASRLTLRCHKKIGKASTRLAKANEQVEEIRTNPDATLEELESCPNITVFEKELEDLRCRLEGLNLLEEKLQKVKGSKGKEVVLPDDVLDLVMELEVNDAPPQRQQRPKKKKKGPRSVAPRLPYFRYYTKCNTEIRVSISISMLLKFYSRETALQIENYY